MDAAKKIILLLALVVACALPASALTPSAPENRVWEKITGTLETHQEAAPQVPQSHQEETTATAETVSECFLAAEATTATVTTSNLSAASISVSDGVATVNVEYAATPLSQLANAVSAQATAMGADTAVVNTGIVADEGLANSLAARAASGQGFMGGTVQATGTAAAPQFTITIPLP